MSTHVSAHGSSHGAPSHAAHGHNEPHIVPIHVYVAVFITLIILTGVTAFVATIDLGKWNIFVALAIAIFKASIVILFFMHVRYSTRMTKFIVGCGFFWLLMLLFITMTDIWTRNWIGVPGR